MSQNAQASQAPDVIDGAIQSVIGTTATPPQAQNPKLPLNPNQNGGPLGMAALGMLQNAAVAHQTRTPDVVDSAIQSYLGSGVEDTGKLPTGPTIGPPPKGPDFSTTLATMGATPQNIAAYPIAKVIEALGDTKDEITNYTQAGRAEHPILARVGDVIQAAQELLTGGQSAGKPLGTKEGILNNPITTAMSLAPAAAEAVPEAIDRVVQGVKGLSNAVQAVRDVRAAKRAEEAAEVASNIPKITEAHFEFLPEPPKPMHGAPLEIESPLDSATISSQGGKGLSPEALKTLQSRQGETIPVGSTARNVLFRDVEPNSKVISDLAAKMNDVVTGAPELDSSVWDGSDVQQKLADLKASVPASERAKGVANINDEIENADDALNSTNLSEILEYRRRLGRSIDWSDLSKNPETPKETVNSARAIIYRALGDTVHRAAPDTIPLDQALAPEIELRSFYRARLGDRAVDDPIGASIEARSEFAKGQKVIETAKYNEQIAQNRKLAGLDEPAAPTTGPVGETLDKAVQRFGDVAPREQDALRKMLAPSVKAGKVFGVNTDWYSGLKTFDKLTPEQQAARFADPTAVRNVLRTQATKQLALGVVKYGSLGLLAHALGVDKAILHGMLGAD